MAKKQKKGRTYKDYFLMGDMQEKDLLLVEKTMKNEEIVHKNLKKVINTSAELAGRTYEDTTLHAPQAVPVAMSWLNPRLFVGDKPGLGKTVMSTGAYAYYREMCMKNGKTPGKLLLVTENNHVLGMTKEMREKFGVNLIPLIDGTTKIERKVKDMDLSDPEIDGVATSWGSLKSNGFLYFYLNHLGMFEMAVFDETSKLINPDSQIFKVTDDLVNKAGGGIPRVMFLNGSSFEKSIYDLYYQFKILSPNLFPSKKFIDENYVIKGGKKWWATEVEVVNGSAKMVKKEKQRGEIVDYKNQSDFKNRIRHHYIARSKSDYSDVLPEYNYRLHAVEMTKKQQKWLDEADVVNASVLNSPTTSDPEAKFDEKTVPKIKEVLDFFEQVVEDRPIIYVYNRESQNKFQELLAKRGYDAEIVSGKVTDMEERQDIIRRFNEGELDTLIFNIEKAINIPTSDRIIFYDVPTMPQRTYQVKGRIDRNNYKDPKFYDFFVYLDSPEMGNIIRLAYFREKQSSAFTGQEEDLYKQLIYQLKKYYEMDQLNRIGELMDELDDEFTDFDMKKVDAEFENLFK